MKLCFSLSSLVILIVNPFLAEYFFGISENDISSNIPKKCYSLSIIQVEGRKSTEENDINDASLSDKFVVVLSPNQMRQSD